MLSRFSSGIIGLALLMMLTASGCAGFKSWYSSFRAQFDLDTQRNNAHPQPFLTQDQLAVQEIFHPMYEKGAQSARVLGSVHFDPKTNKLNESGIEKLRVILEQRRDMDVYVATTLTPEVDQSRQENVRQLLAQYEFTGQAPQVSGLFIKPSYARGIDELETRTKYISNQYPPSLKTVEGNISGSAGQ